MHGAAAARLPRPPALPHRHRGLVEVLRAWPRIRAGVGPTATLHVYYGFTPKFLAWGRQHMADFDRWLADAKALLDEGADANATRCSRLGICIKK